jgi:hypothetical protein
MCCPVRNQYIYGYYSHSKNKAVKRTLRIYTYNSFKHFKRLKKIYHIYYICIMSEDLTDFFSTDSNNWNYNEMINKPSIDPYNNNKSKIPTAII